jgi:hypothetical protein
MRIKVRVQIAVAQDHVTIPLFQDSPAQVRLQEKTLEGWL